MKILNASENSLVTFDHVLFFTWHQFLRHIISKFTGTIRSFSIASSALFLLCLNKSHKNRTVLTVYIFLITLRRCWCIFFPFKFSLPHRNSLLLVKLSLLFQDIPKYVDLDFLLFIEVCVTGFPNTCRLSIHKIFNCSHLKITRPYFMSLHDPFNLFLGAKLYLV